MPRPQFTLRALLVLLLAAACFFGGMAMQRKLDTPVLVRRTQGVVHYKKWGFRPSVTETIRLHDGTEWKRSIHDRPQE